VTLSFPDAPKLELDELIDELVTRARDVQRAQGRLRALLRAIERINGDLSLSAVLRHVAEAARTLSGARYAALGVVNDHEGLEQFIYDGIDAGTAGVIGALPTGTGLLGALITDPRPIRLADLGLDPRSAGFPSRHPPMTSFLGVPIRVRGEVFGTLYLTDSDRGEFSADDEELVGAFALAAGSAISNARLYDDARRRQQWLTVSSQISEGMLAETGEDPLLTIVRSAAELTAADAASIALVTEDGDDVLVEVAVGEGTQGLVGLRFALRASFADTALEQLAPRQAVIDSQGEDTSCHLGVVMDIGPVLVVPLARSPGAGGVLSLARRRGGSPFTCFDVDLASGFAALAGVALEFARARADQQKMALFADRDRIARDLHDHVIQQLFAIGLSLQAIAETVGPDHDVEARLRDKVRDVDRTIRQIRTSIFELHGPLIGDREGVRADALTVAAELIPALGFAPHVTFSGPVDTVITGPLAEDVLACLREALTNVAKHAGASSVDVHLHLIGDEVRLQVLDDGRGVPAGARLSGLSGLDNLRVRAENRGGSFHFGPAPAGGTELLWKAPIR
jgi:signal transduction histidine kinase